MCGLAHGLLHDMAFLCMPEPSLGLLFAIMGRVVRCSFLAGICLVSHSYLGGPSHIVNSSSFPPTRATYHCFSNSTLAIGLSNFVGLTIP